MRQHPQTIPAVTIALLLGLAFLAELEPEVVRARALGI